MDLLGSGVWSQPCHSGEAGAGGGGGQGVCWEQGLRPGGKQERPVGPKAEEAGEQGDKTARALVPLEPSLHTGPAPGFSQQRAGVARRQLRQRHGA